MKSKYLGVNFDNIRKSLYLLFFGIDLVTDSAGNKVSLADDFNSPKYKYIIPMRGVFENPIGDTSKDTFILFWIERDESLTRDDYIIDKDNVGWNRQKCVATIKLRFVGKDAEDWVKSMRHIAKRSGVTDIWEGVCNAERLEHTAPIVPTRVNYSGLNDEIAFDVRFKLYYNECIATGWKPLEGIDFEIHGEVDIDTPENAEGSEE